MPLKRHVTFFWRLNPILFLGFFLAILSFFITFIGIPPFTFGYYASVEAISAALWSLGGLAALWHFWAAKIYPSLLLRNFRHPLVFGPFALGGISALTSLLHPIPLENWVGCPQMGEGILTFFSLGFLASLYLILYRIPFFRKWLVGVALLTGLVISALVVVGSQDSPFLSFRHWDYAPYHFTACIGFFVPAFIVFYIIYFEKYRRNLFYHSLFLALIIGVSYYSSNKTLSYAIYISLVPLGLFKFFIKKPSMRTRLLPWGLLSLAGIYIIALLVGEAFPEITPSSFISRSVLIRVTFAHFAEGFSFQDFIYFLFGRGWGSYTDYVASNLYLIKNVYVDPLKGTPFSEILLREEFHSHNSLVEYLISMGVVGLGFLLWISYRILQNLRTQYFLIGVFYFSLIVLLSSAWFQEHSTVTHNLFALVALCGTYKHTLKFSLKIHIVRYGSLVLFPLMTLFAVMNGIIGQSAFNALQLNTDTFFQDLEAALKPGYKDYDKYLGGKRILSLMNVHSDPLFDHLDYQEKQKKVTALYKNKSKTKEDKIALIMEPKKVFEIEVKMADYIFDKHLKKGNLFAIILAINTLNNLSTNPQTKPLFLGREDLQGKWLFYIETLLKYAPYRYDLAITYLSHLLEGGQDAKAMDFLQKHIFSKREKDALGLWYAGIIHLGDRDTFNLGMDQLKEALDLGIEQFIPIPKEKVQQIKSYHLTMNGLF